MDTDKKFCSACGSKLRSGVKFCEKCGATVEASHSSSDFKGLLTFFKIALLLVFVGLGSYAGWRWYQEQPSQTPSPEMASEVVTELPQRSEPVQTPTPPASSEAVARPESEYDLAGVDGIVDIKLDEASTYLPLINNRYRHAMKYEDGDEGMRETVVGVKGDSGVLSAVEFTTSKLFPDDPPSLWVHHYFTRQDGVYFTTDEEPGKAQLWLPNNLTIGTKWKNAIGRYEVVSFDTELTVSGIEFTNVLAYRQRIPEHELDRTIWLAPGYGEIQVRPTGGDFDLSRFVDFQPEPLDSVERLLQRHVVNERKVR